MSTFNIPGDYGYVVIVSALISFQCALSSLAVSGLRRSLNVPYPDSGDGRYAAKLTDLQWEQFHNAQRAHRNYTEQIGVTQSLLITGGLIAPRSAAVAGLLYMIGRQFYYHGYVNHGPSGRFKGAILLDIGLMGLLGVALYSGFILLGF